jgi:hypothetical protein
MISAANSRASSDDQTTQTLRSNPWKNTVPSTIDFYNSSVDHFPPLNFPLVSATATTITHPTTDSSSDTITAATLQSALQDALAEQQQKHREELESIRSTFQAEINSLRNEIIQQRDHQTTPTSNRLEEKIDMLMSHFQLHTFDKVRSTQPETPSKSPYRKKSRGDTSSLSPETRQKNNANPSESMDTDDPATLTAMLLHSYENIEASSSQDGDIDRLSGSEH